MLHIEAMASGGEWGGWRIDRRRVVVAHAIGFFGANLVCGTLTLLLLHWAGRALSWALSPSLEISAIAVGIVGMLAGAALLTPRRATSVPALSSDSRS